MRLRLFAAIFSCLFSVGLVAQPPFVGGTNYGPTGVVVAPVANPMPIFEDAVLMAEALDSLSRDMLKYVEQNRAARFRIAQPVWTSIGVRPGAPIQNWTGGFAQHLVLPHWSQTPFPGLPDLTIEDLRPQDQPDYWVSVHLDTFQKATITFLDRYQQFRSSPLKDAAIWHDVGKHFFYLNVAYQRAMASTFFYIEALKRTYYSGMGVANQPPHRLDERLFALHYRAVGVFELMYMLRARLTPLMPINNGVPMYVGRFCYEASMMPFMSSWALVQQPVGFMPFPFFVPPGQGGVGAGGMPDIGQYQIFTSVPGVGMDMQNFPQIDDDGGWQGRYEEWRERFYDARDFSGQSIPATNEALGKMREPYRQGLQYDVQKRQRNQDWGSEFYPSEQYERRGRESLREQGPVPSAAPGAGVDRSGTRGDSRYTQPNGDPRYNRNGGRSVEPRIPQYQPGQYSPSTPSGAAGREYIDPGVDLRPGTSRRR